MSVRELVHVSKHLREHEHIVDAPCLVTSTRVQRRINGHSQVVTIVVQLKDNRLRQLIPTTVASAAQLLTVTSTVPVGPHQLAIRKLLHFLRTQWTVEHLELIHLTHKHE